MLALRRTVPASALALALLLAVAGCGGDDDKKSGSPKPSATPTTSQSPVTLEPDPTDLPGSGANPGVPSDFPSDKVPLLAGPVDQPLGEGSGEEGKKGWVLELQLEQKAGACFAAAAAELVGHGFTKQPGETNDNGRREALFTAPGYAVIISTSPSDAGGCRLSYEVGQVAS